MTKRNLTIGLDVGGTKIIGALISPTGRVINTTRLLSKALEGKTPVVSQIQNAVADLWNSRVGAIGIGMAGSVDSKKGVFRQGPHFHRSVWGMNPRALLRRYPARVSFLNDAQAFTLGEAHFGAGRGKRLVVGITLGTGIGGGIVFEGRLLHGAHGTAGEFGHMTIHADNAVACRCGKENHLGAFVSGSTGRETYARLRRMSLSQVDMFRIEKEAKSGKRLARHIWEHLQRSLAIGLANLLVSFDPDIIVVGGGLARAKTLWQPAVRMARGLVPYPTLAKTPIVEAECGDLAAPLGAAFFARR